MDELSDRETAQTAADLNEICQLALRQLTPPRGDLSFTAASTLSRLNQEGPIRLSSLAAFEGVAQPSMTQLVQRLEAQGLVRRGRDAGDGRVVLVGITDEGRAFLEARRETRVEWMAGLLSQLEPGQARTLAAALDTALPVLRRLAETTQNH